MIFFADSLVIILQCHQKAKNKIYCVVLDTFFESLREKTQNKRID